MGDRNPPPALRPSPRHGHTPAAPRPALNVRDGAPAAGCVVKPHKDGGIELLRSEIAALLAHASTDKTRARICGVHFVTGDAPLAESTDGHRCARVLGSGSGPSADWIHSRATVEAAADLCRRMKADHVRFTPTGYVVLEHAVEAPPVNAVFPPTSRIIPTFGHEELGLPSEVNADYLADTALVTRAANDAWDREWFPRCRTARERREYRKHVHYGLVMHPAKGALDPLVFTSGPWLVILMPRCGDCDRRKPFAKLVIAAAKSFEKTETRAETIADNYEAAYKAGVEAGRQQASS